MTYCDNQICLFVSTDYNECNEGNHGCHPDATCINEPAGSYDCTCKPGYKGTGFYCTGECYQFIS